MTLKKDQSETWSGFQKKIGSILGFEAHVFSFVPETGSTNDDLKKLWHPPGTPEPRILVTGHQSSGRGLYGRTWIDRPAKMGFEPNSLLASFTWTTPDPHETPLPIPLLVGLAMHRVLMKRCENPPYPWIKWPNDLWIGNGKIAGVLVEAITIGNTRHIVVGIGMNLTEKPDSPGIEHGIASVRDLNLHLSAPDLLESILVQWSSVFSETDGRLLRTEFNRASREFFDRNIRVEDENGGFFLARPLSLDEKGGLWVDANEGGHRLISDARRIQLV